MRKYRKYYRKRSLDLIQGGVAAIFVGVIFLKYGSELWHGMVFLLIGAILILAPIIKKCIKKAIYHQKFKDSAISQIDCMSGEEFEHYLEVHFAKLGYRTRHTGKSGDYGADLILKDAEGKKIAVQAKRYREQVGVRAIQEVIAAKEYYHCDKAMVVTNSFFTPNARKLAKDCNVELWDRNVCIDKFKINTMN